MAIERRAALRLLAGGVVGSLLPLPLNAEATEGAEAVDRLYLSARADATGGYRVSSFSANGARCLDLPLPGRGHSFAVRPGGHEAVHFARRPGRFALVLDLARGTVGHTVETPGGRHFYGHGVFSRDGRRLYATENDFGGNAASSASTTRRMTTGALASSSPTALARTTSGFCPTVKPSSSPTAASPRGRTCRA